MILDSKVSILGPLSMKKNISVPPRLCDVYITLDVARNFVEKVKNSFNNSYLKKLFRSHWLMLIFEPRRPIS